MMVLMKLFFEARKNTTQRGRGPPRPAPRGAGVGVGGVGSLGRPVVWDDVLVDLKVEELPVLSRVSGAPCGSHPVVRYSGVLMFYRRSVHRHSLVVQNLI